MNMFEKKSEKVNISCESCMHYIVCGHKDYMKKALEQVEALKLEKDEFIEITTKCTEYKEVMSMPRGVSSVTARQIEHWQ